MADDARNASSAGESAPSLKEGLREEAAGAKKAYGEAKADIRDTAQQIAADAREAASRKAQEARAGLAGNIAAFGEALGTAGDHLAENGQPRSARLLDEAAARLKECAGSLEHKSLGEVYGDLRAFGRRNPGGLFAGSVLAGLALGRVLRTAAEAGGSQDRTPAASEVQPEPAGGHEPVPPATAAGPGPSP